MKRLLLAVGLVLLAVCRAAAAEPDKDAVRKHIAALKDEDPSVRGEAIAALAEMGPRARAALPALARVLKADPQGDFRYAAEEALEKIGPDEKVGLPALRDALQDRDGLVRLGAARAVLKHDRKAPKKAVEVLIECIQLSKDDPEELPPVHVYRAIKDIGPKAKPTEAAIIRCLGELDLFHRTLALEALSRIGSDHETLVPALTGTLLDGNHLRFLRSLTRDGWPLAEPLLLGRYDPREPVLFNLSEDVRQQRELTRECRLLAAGLLGALGPRAKAAVPALTACLRDRELRTSAKEALDKIQGRR